MKNGESRVSWEAGLMFPNLSYPVRCMQSNHHEAFY